MNKAVKWIKDSKASISRFWKDYKPLLMVLGVLTILFAFLWLGTTWGHDFGLNAFTETLGIVVTVFVIDKIIQRQESRRLRPLRIAAWRDVGEFVNQIVSHWLNVYNWSVPNPNPPEHSKDLFTLPYFEAIRANCNLDNNAYVFPQRTWWELLPQQQDHHHMLGEKILDRHAAVLDPVAYGLVHKVVNGFLKQDVGLNMLPVLRQTGANLAIYPEPHILGNYWFVLPEELKSVADLHTWYFSHESEYAQERY